MIVGVVNDREAIVPITLRGPEGHEQSVNVVLDTGYTGSFCLPSTLIQALHLPWQGCAKGLLADGSECLFDVYQAEIIWDGAARSVLVDETESDPLIGMTALDGHELRMEVCPQGKVEITPLKTQ